MRGEGKNTVPNLPASTDQVPYDVSRCPFLLTLLYTGREAFTTSLSLYTGPSSLMTSLSTAVLEQTGGSVTSNMGMIIHSAPWILV